MRLNFLTILQTHAARYPLMQPQDYAKLLYQSEFGPRHLLAAPDNLKQEWQALSDSLSLPDTQPEVIGGGFCRFHLNSNYPPAAISLLNQLFQLTASQSQGNITGLQQKIEQLQKLPQTARLPDFQTWLANWRQQGYPPAHHSAIFRQAYKPHYRVLRSDYAGFFPALWAFAQLAQTAPKNIIAALDGRCGSGKTNLAQLISQLLPASLCRVIHMDDFYLPVEKRPTDWLEQSGGNLDLARLQTEVIQPAKAGAPITYQPYDCQTASLQPARQLPPARLTIIEGSYALHPTLAPNYDLKIFLTVSPAEQAERLQAREGEYFPNFVRRWIPLEEQYLQKCNVTANADLIINTDQLF